MVRSAQVGLVTPRLSPSSEVSAEIILVAGSECGENPHWDAAVRRKSSLRCSNAENIRVATSECGDYPHWLLT